MELLKPKDIFKHYPMLTVFGGEYFARFLMNILRFSKLNKIYSRIAEKKGIEFIDEVIRILELKISFDEEELKRVPKEGPLIVVSNHPFAGIDGLLLIKYLSMVRGDVKVVAHYMLQKIEPVSNYFVAGKVNDQGSYEVHQLNTLKNAVAHLNQGGALCVFPAGETSTYGTFDSLTDQVWQYPVVKFIKKARVPVLPVFFQGTHSRFFHLVAKIHPSLRLSRIPGELLSKKNKVFKIRIGSPISVEDQDKFCDIYQFGRFLRAKTYSMESDIPVRKFFKNVFIPEKKPESVAEAIPKNLLLDEIQKLKKDYTLFNLKNYSVYCAPSRMIPNILNEIGRLREITFREVGEGTNQSIDLDEFDLYYNQMFIWDNTTDKLVGAYRIGLGSDILAQYGKRGFYLHTLFNIDDGFIPVLNESLELGRSFVVTEYQRKPLPLFMLWKGILYFLLKNPQYRYLIGPVSISNNYSNISKELIIKFILGNHFDWKMASKVKPRNSFKFKSANESLNLLMANMDRDIDRLDKTIGDLDEMNSGLPVLLKKYIKLNAKIIGFNVDPNFNNCLDGFIVLDVFNVPKNVIESLSKEVNDGSILERFYTNRE